MKVGDRVRIIRESRIHHNCAIGSQATVSYVYSSDDRIDVRCINYEGIEISQIILIEDIELLNKEKIPTLAEIKRNKLK